MKFWEKADKFPPVAVRIFAKENGVAITTEQIARRSGMSPEEVTRVSMLTSWDGETVGTMRSFVRGCNFDLEDWPQFKRNINYARNKPAWAYIKKSPEVQFLSKLINIYRKSTHA